MPLAPAIKPIRAATALPAAFGWAFAVSGGQTALPPADSVLTFGLSPLNRYRVRPLASTSALPIELCLIDSAEAAGAVASL